MYVDIPLVESSNIWIGTKTAVFFFETIVPIDMYDIYMTSSFTK